MVLVVEVVEGRVNSDGSSFADYVYSLHVRIDNSFDSVLERSYLDFCDLDAHIRAEVHSLDIQQCPLLGANAIRKQKVKPSDPFGVLRRATIGGEVATSSKEYTPLFADDRNSYMISLFDVDEDIQSKIQDLTEWMAHIMRKPAVLELTAIARFLNIEEKCFRRCPVRPDREVSDYDFLVPQKSLKSKQLLTKFVLPIEVCHGDILVWRFRSKPHDVAYGIDVGDAQILPSRRYASGREEVFGMMQVPDMLNGQPWTGKAVCDIKFENKYAGVGDVSVCV